MCKCMYVSDENVDSSKVMALVVRGEGGPHPDSYCASLQDGIGRRSISSQCSAPPSLTTDVVNVGVLGIPAGLQQYRASIKPLMGYGDSQSNLEDGTHSLHRYTCLFTHIHNRKSLKFNT